MARNNYRRSSTKTREVHWTSSFVDGLVSAVNDWRPSAHKASFGGVKPKSVTAILNQDWENVKCPRGSMRPLRAYKRLNLAEKRDFHENAGLYTYSMESSAFTSEEAAPETNKNINSNNNNDDDKNNNNSSNTNDDIDSNKYNNNGSNDNINSNINTSINNSNNNKNSNDDNDNNSENESNNYKAT